MRDFAIRFVCGGLLIAGLPWFAARFGDAAAGLALLFPAVTLAGFTVLALERGMGALVDASAATVVAVPVIAVFLITVNLAARHGLSLAWTLGAGVTAWLAAATILTLLRRAMGG